MNESNWFQNLASFAGQYFRKYPSVELESLLCYILYQVCTSCSLVVQRADCLRLQLRDTKGVELLVLKELISNMAAVECARIVSRVLH